MCLNREEYWKKQFAEAESEIKDLKFKVHKLETSLKAEREERNKLIEEIIKNKVTDDIRNFYDTPDYITKELIEFYRRHPQFPVCCQIMLKDCENNFPFVKNWTGNVTEVVNEPGNRSIVITTVEKVDDKWTCHRFVYNFDNKTITMDKD